MIAAATIIILFTISIINADGNNDIVCAIDAYNNKYIYYFIINGSCCLPSSISAQSIPAGSQNAYYKLSNKLTLFRMVNGSNVLPYDFFTQAITPSQFGVKDHNNYSLNFRSVLLDDWINIRPISMNVTIRNVDDEIVAWLHFQVKSSDNITSWFSFDNFIDCYPWDRNNLKNISFNVFSIIGDRTYNRSFFIHPNFAGCDVDLGVLAVFDNVDICSYKVTWLPISVKHPEIFYFVNGNKPGTWKDFRHSGKSLEIVGTYKSNIIIFG